MRAIWYLSPDELTDVAAFVRSRSSIPPEKLVGNPERGRLIYARSACAAECEQRIHPGVESREVIASWI
jgi:hypothetical protein